MFHYKKSAFWLSVVAVVVVTVVSLSFVVSKQLKSASENLPNQGTELKTITESPSVTPELKADAVDEVKISMYYKGSQVSGKFIYPKENSEGMKEIVDVLNSASSAAKKSVNDVPSCDRVIKVELLPDKTVYLYRNDGKYYEETPYVSIGELTKEAFERILGEFGPVRPFPEDMDKTQFLAAVQEMLERYRSGNPPENGMEYKFDAVPEGISLPYVDSADDFELEYGDGTECLYFAVVSFGKNDTNSIKMQLNDVMLGNETEWTVTGVSFGRTGTDNSADNTKK